MVPLFVPSTSLLQSCFTAFSNLLSGFVLFDISFGSILLGVFPGIGDVSQPVIG